MTGKISHIAFYTDKMNETIDFYEKLLGFTHGFALKKTTGEPWIEYLANANGDFIELFYSDAPIKNEQDIPVEQKFSHFCLEVDNITAVIERAQAVGIDLYRPLTTGMDLNLQCWFQDPNGVLIEIMQLDKNSPQARLRETFTPNNGNTTKNEDAIQDYQ